MTVKSKDSIIDLISKTMEENYKFFDSNYEMKEILSEIVELTNDAIDYIPLSKDDSFEQMKKIKKTISLENIKND